VDNADPIINDILRKVMTNKVVKKLIGAFNV